MLITKEINKWSDKEYWGITTGKEGALEGVTRQELLELALEIVPLLTEKELLSLDACVESEWINKWTDEDELKEVKNDKS